MAATRIQGEVALDDGIVSLVLAAGAARRFGGRKQLALLHGRPLLEHTLAAAAAGPGRRTAVVLGAYAKEIEDAVDLCGAEVVRCRDWRRGRGASLQAGLAALGSDVAAALILLGDEPFVLPEASGRLIAARQPGLLAARATYGGRPGHPVLIERQLFEPIRSAGPSAKPAALLREAGILAVECGDLGNPADVDTPAQLAELERRTAGLGG